MWCTPSQTMSGRWRGRRGGRWEGDSKSWGGSGREMDGWREKRQWILMSSALLGHASHTSINSLPSYLSILLLLKPPALSPLLSSLSSLLLQLGQLRDAHHPPQGVLRASLVQHLVLSTHDPHGKIPTAFNPRRLLFAGNQVPINSPSEVSPPKPGRCHDVPGQKWLPPAQLLPVRGRDPLCRVFRYVARNVLPPSAQPALVLVNTRVLLANQLNLEGFQSGILAQVKFSYNANPHGNQDIPIPIGTNSRLIRRAVLLLAGTQLCRESSHNPVDVSTVINPTVPGTCCPPRSFGPGEEARVKIETIPRPRDVLTCLIIATTTLSRVNK